MLVRLSFLFRTVPRAYFCTFDEHRARQLTRDINNTKSASDLMLILNTNRGRFNLVHISVLLKKLNTKSITDHQQLLDSIYKQVQHSLTKIKPNPQNSRAIANIIGYTGNCGYTGINQTLKQIDYYWLFKFVNDKQFVMVITGLLKLELVKDVIDGDSLDNYVRKFVGRCYNFGFLISVWRNLIKWGYCTQQLNQILINKIVKCRPSQNIKDLGYLAYCYTESPYIKSQIPELTQKIISCSKQFLYTTRINIFEMCILINHVIKVSQIAKKIQLTAEIIQMITNQYIRIVQGNIDLRSLANGYFSLINLGTQVYQEVYNKTVEKFVDLLQDGSEDICDYQSVTSLFLQLITTRPQKSSTSYGKLTNDEELLSKLYLQSILKPLRHYLFSTKACHILNLSTKEYQKLLYSFYLFQKQDNTFKFTQEEIIKLKQSLYNKIQFSQLQITTIMSSFSGLSIKDQEVCHFLKNKLELLKDLSKNQCWVGLKGVDCLGCFQNRDRGQL